MAIALLLAILLITFSCAALFAVHPWWFPAGVSSYAAALDHQFMIALWLLGGLFIAGQILLAVFLYRYRARRRTNYSQGNWQAELTWTAAIALLFFWFNISGERLWSAMRLHSHDEGHDNSAVQVEVTGMQFQWYFRYAGADGQLGHTNALRFAKPEEGNPLGIDPADPAGRDDIVSTSLMLPAGRDVELTLRAQDVIHSLFIPAMRFKQDTVPGMDIHTHFKPMQPGTYEIACSQLCGLGHYRMRAVARVVSEEEFKEWIRKRSGDR